MPKEAIEVFQKAIDLESPAEDQLWYFPTIAAAYADAVGRWTTRADRQNAAVM